MTKIKFCANGDQRIAVGTGIRPMKFCRPCHVDAYQGEFQQWKVIVPDPEIAIACAKTGEDIGAGGTVWLDPVETNIPALVYAGFIEPVAAPAAKPARPAASTGD